MYSSDLAYVHEAGFGGYARRAAPDIVRLLRARGIDRGPIVEFGCGGGTVARTLTAAGFAVLGIDISSAMIRLARARAPRATFRVGALATARIPPCRAIVAIGEVVSYVSDARASHEAALQRFFIRARAALGDEGLLLFDFMASPAGRTYRLKHRRGAGWSIALHSSFDRRRRMLTRDMVVRRNVGGRVRQSREVHRVRIFPRREMAHMLRRAGFAFEMRESLGRVPLIAGDVMVVATPQT